MQLVACALVCLLSACQTKKPVSRPVYGSDGRSEIIEANAIQCQVGAATMAVFSRSSLLQNADGAWRFRKDSRLQDASWCSTTRFSEQPAHALCTAFLISADRVATAGHCINASDDPYGPGLNCQDALFVFDFKAAIDGQIPDAFENRQVIPCAGIVAGIDSAVSADWRVARLSRPSIRQPLQLHDGAPVPDGTPLHSIGHPQGLPMKLMTGATLLEHRSIQEFVTDLDSFKGSSGSPVFITDRQRPLVIGMISSGAMDHMESSDGEPCRSAVFCAVSGECDGELAVNSQVLAPFATPAQQSSRLSHSDTTDMSDCFWCQDPLRSRHWQCDAQPQGLG